MAHLKGWRASKVTTQGEIVVACITTIHFYSWGRQAEQGDYRRPAYHQQLISPQSTSRV